MDARRRTLVSSRDQKRDSQHRNRRLVNVVHLRQVHCSRNAVPPSFLLSLSSFRFVTRVRSSITAGRETVHGSGTVRLATTGYSVAGCAPKTNKTAAFLSAERYANATRPVTVSTVFRKLHRFPSNLLPSAPVLFLSNVVAFLFHFPFLIATIPYHRHPVATCSTPVRFTVQGVGQTQCAFAMHTILRRPLHPRHC